MKNGMITHSLSTLNSRNTKRLKQKGHIINEEHGLDADNVHFILLLLCESEEIK